MSSEFRQFSVSDHAYAKGEMLGIDGDVEARIARMARRSAPCTHPNGNRRFEDFLLTVDGNTVTDIERFY